MRADPATQSGLKGLSRSMSGIFTTLFLVCLLIRKSHSLPGCFDPNITSCHSEQIVNARLFMHHKRLNKIPQSDKTGELGLFIYKFKNVSIQHAPNSDETTRRIYYAADINNESCMSLHAIIQLGRFVHSNMAARPTCAMQYR